MLAHERTKRGSHVREEPMEHLMGHMTLLQREWGLEDEWQAREREQRRDRKAAGRANRHIRETAAKALVELAARISPTVREANTSTSTMALRKTHSTVLTKGSTIS
jgi:hypothetical protein